MRRVIFAPNAIRNKRFSEKHVEKNSNLNNIVTASNFFFSFQTRVYNPSDLCRPIATVDTETYGIRNALNV